METHGYRTIAVSVSAVALLASSTICLISDITLAQTQTSAPAPASAPATAQGTQATPSQLNLEDGTPIKLRLQETISSADAHVDQRVDFDVLDGVKLNDLLVIPKGSIAWGTVTEAEAKKRMARGGKLNINIDAVRLADGEKAALRGVKEVKGGGHTGAMTGGIVASAIVFFPAAPFFLFMHGKDVTIPKGTEVTVYINGNTAIDPAKFTSAGESPSSSSAATVAPSATSTGPGQLSIKSTPDGADITVDGKYVGSTPSTVKLFPGEHTIKIDKSGFKPWERTLTVTSDSQVSVSATLEQP